MQGGDDFFDPNNLLRPDFGGSRDDLSRYEELLSQSTSTGDALVALASFKIKPDQEGNVSMIPLNQRREIENHPNKKARKEANKKIANLDRQVEIYNRAVDLVIERIEALRGEYDVEVSGIPMDATRFWRFLSEAETIRSKAVNNMLENARNLQKQFHFLTQGKGDLDDEFFLLPYIEATRCLPPPIGFPLFNVEGGFDDIPDEVKKKMQDKPLMHDAFVAMGKVLRNHLRQLQDQDVYQIDPEIYAFGYSLLETSIIGTIARRSNINVPLDGVQVTAYFIQQLIGDVNTGVPIMESPVKGARVDKDFITGLSATLTTLASNLVPESSEDFLKGFADYMNLRQSIPEFDYYFAMGLRNSALNNPSFDLATYIEEVFSYSQDYPDFQEIIEIVAGNWAAAIQEITGAYYFEEKLIQDRFGEHGNIDYKIDIEALNKYGFQTYTSSGTEQGFDFVTGLNRYEIHAGDTGGVYYLDLFLRRNREPNGDLNKFPHYIYEETDEPEALLRVNIIINDDGSVSAVPQTLPQGIQYNNIRSTSKRIFIETIVDQLVQKRKEEEEKKEREKSIGIAPTRTKVNTSRPSRKTFRKRKEEKVKEEEAVRQSSRYNPIIAKALDLSDAHKKLILAYNNQTGGFIIRKIKEIPHRKIFELRPTSGGDGERVLIEMRGMEDGTTRYVAFLGFDKSEQSDVFRNLRES